MADEDQAKYRFVVTVVSREKFLITTPRRLTDREMYETRMAFDAWARMEAGSIIIGEALLLDPNAIVVELSIPEIDNLTSEQIAARARLLA